MKPKLLRGVFSVLGKSECQPDYRSTEPLKVFGNCRKLYQTLKVCLFEHFLKIKPQFRVNFLSDKFHDIATMFNRFMLLYRAANWRILVGNVSYFANAWLTSCKAYEQFYLCNFNLATLNFVS